MKSTQSKGFVIVASKNHNFYIYACNLMESIKDFYPEALITLVTEERFLDDRADEADQVIFCDNHYRAKLWGMANSPYDITMYGLLLELLAKGTGLKAGQLIGQLGDCHLYNNHIDQANEFVSRYHNPQCAELELDYGLFNDTLGILHIPELNEIRLNNYNPLPSIKAPLSVGK